LDINIEFLQGSEAYGKIVFLKICRPYLNMAKTYIDLTSIVVPNGNLLLRTNKQLTFGANYDITKWYAYAI